MTKTVEEERDALLPQIAQDQRDLTIAVDELRSASIAAAKRGLLWIAAGIAVLVVTRFLARRLP